MIDDLSKTLRAILTQPGLMEPLASAHVVFEHPEEGFQPQQTTIDLFLYDIREDLNLRSNEPVIERNNGKVTTHPPPVRLACSYLVTAWPVGGTEVALQEHRLLGQVVQVLSKLPTIPARFLPEGLKNQTPPLPLVTAVVDPQKNLSEFWTALGARMRPSITVTATIAIDVIESKTTPMVITVQQILGELVRIDGRVTDGANKPVVKATVTVVELGREAQTDRNGRFILNRMPPGGFTLRIRKNGAQREVAIKVPPEKGGAYDVQLG